MNDDPELAARRTRMIETLTHIAEECEQTARDIEYWHTLPIAADEGSVDCEWFRVQAHAAREALRAVRENRPIEPRWQELLGLTKGTQA